MNGHVQGRTIGTCGQTLHMTQGGTSLSNDYQSVDHHHSFSSFCIVHPTHIQASSLFGSHVGSNNMPFYWVGCKNRGSAVALVDPYLADGQAQFFS